VLLVKSRRQNLFIYFFHNRVYTFGRLKGAIMVKVNFILEEEVRDELNRVIPSRKRSRVVNQAIKKELLRLKRQSATENLLTLREETARYGSNEIDKLLKSDRSRA
jgi:hypothetical protein